MRHHGLAPHRTQVLRSATSERSPVTRARLLIDANLLRELGNGLYTRPYEIYPPGVRVRQGGTSRVLEPNLAIARSPGHFAIDGDELLLNPALIFEVLSEASEGRYRGELFRRYTAIPSLGGIVFVAPGAAFLERFARQPEGGWAVATFGPGESVALPEIDLDLRVDEVYRGLSPLPA
jgi:Uma2 family endonuclease